MRKTDREEESQMGPVRRPPISVRLTINPPKGFVKPDLNKRVVNPRCGLDGTGAGLTQPGSMPVPVSGPPVISLALSP